MNPDFWYGFTMGVLFVGIAIFVIELLRLEREPLRMPDDWRPRDR